MKIYSARNRNSFSLMELLVVIAIITILASLLLPAIEKAKDSAKTLRCINHHKQLGTYTLLFVDDNNGRFPGGGSRLGGSTSWHAWYSIMKWEYLDDVPLGLNWRNEFKEGTLNCPATKSTGGSWRVIGINRNLTDSYSMNITDINQWPKPPTDPSNPQNSSYRLGSPIRKVKHTSDLIMYQDWTSAGNPSFAWSSNYPSMNIQYYPKALDYGIKVNSTAAAILRHGTGNTLKNTRIHVDGHAKAVLPDPDEFTEKHFKINP